MTSCTAGNCLQSLGGATVVLQEAGNQSPFLWPGVFVATMYVVVYFLIVFLVFNRMVHSCIVPGCNNRSNKEVCKGIKFYVLPFKDEKLLERWLTLACRRREDVTVHSRICSVHFLHGNKKNNKDIPQIFPWQKYTSTPTPLPLNQVENHLTPSQIVYHDHLYCSPSYKPLYSANTCTGSSYLTPIVATDILRLNPTTTDVSTNTDASLQSPLPFSIDLFIDDDEAIQFYTGFESYNVLHICFRFLGDAVYHLQYRGSTVKSTVQIETRGAPRVLTPLNEFFLVLCRLRCAMMENDLAHRFGISQSTVSRIFITWICFLYFKLKDINIWPSRAQVNKYMPNNFKSMYPTTRCIIDATEIFIQIPSNPQAQQLTFSSYCFVSNLYGGNISDRELTKQSGLLDLLEPGDSVMADRGFTIADMLDVRGVMLNIPPLKTNEQFTQREITNTRRIANLRIHVERAIGRIKYFKLLSDLPNSMARAANQIFFVCTMLSNFRSPLCT